jgi:hypothetical protein
LLIGLLRLRIETLKWCVFLARSSGFSSSRASRMREAENGGNVGIEPSRRAIIRQSIQLLLPLGKADA